ncbi:MAG: PilZ domain-containing protein [Deltaproteobacteria bacterium]|nr:PilZ domain-containing protein [Deltaproteobacteria bacterium]
MLDNNSDVYERRQAVRVMGRNLFYFQPVSREKFAALFKDFEAGVPPYSQEGLSEIETFIGAQSALARIRARDADLGDFLAHLDAKVNLILKNVTSSKNFFDKLTLHDLNLSGRGISFISDYKIEPGEILEFHIALLPTYTYVYCFGKVVSCKAQPENEGKTSYRVAAEFVLIMEDDQEKLIRHNFKQQSLALRNRRGRG